MIHWTSSWGFFLSLPERGSWKSKGLEQSSTNNKSQASSFCKLFLQMFLYYSSSPHPLLHRQAAMLASQLSPMVDNGEIDVYCFCCLTNYNPVKLKDGRWVTGLMIYLFWYWNNITFVTPHTWSGKRGEAIVSCLSVCPSVCLLGSSDISIYWYTEKNKNRYVHNYIGKSSTNLRKVFTILKTLWRTRLHLEKWNVGRTSK